MTAGPRFHALFAAGLDHLPLNGTTSSNNSSGAVLGDMLTTVLLALGVGALLALGAWLKYGRKRNRSGSSRRTAKRAATQRNPVPVAVRDDDDDDEDVTESGAAGNGNQPHQHRRKRRPRRNHRPRNPTLAETGGLPPERTGPPPSLLG